MLDFGLQKRYNWRMELRAGLAWVSGENTPHKIVITRIMNFGTWDEWQAMRHDLPENQILDAVEHPLRGQWTPRGKAFAECVFDRHMSNDALIRYDA